MSTQNDNTGKVPVGLGTVAGLGGTATMWAVALITALLNGDHSPETRASLIAGALALATTISGRMFQAAAKYIAASLEKRNNPPVPPTLVSSADKQRVAQELYAASQAVSAGQAELFDEREDDPEPPGVLDGLSVTDIVPPDDGDLQAHADPEVPSA